MEQESRGIQALSLNEVVKHSVSAYLRRYHLNRDWIIGLIGDRGSGKSLGGGNLLIRDFMMNDEPAWSNMNIKMNVEVDDEQAAQFVDVNGKPLIGGEVTYEAEHIEKQAFLALDSRYEGGCFFFDEFNLEYGEARRSSANVNLMTDRAIQQLRKLQCGLIYTVLNEMYVDSRIRENTDIFIKCSDVAFKPENLKNKMRQGEVFEWYLYPMSTKLFGVGQTYNETNKPIGPIHLTLRNMWDVIDTYERQAAGRTKYSDSREFQNKELMPIEMTEDPVVVRERSQWGWLDDRIKHFYELHVDDGEVIEISKEEFRDELGIEVDFWGPSMAQIRRKMPDLTDDGRKPPQKYYIKNRMFA